MNDPVASSSIVDEHVEPAVAETTTGSTNAGDDDGTDLLATQPTMTTVAVVDEPTATPAESGLVVVQPAPAAAANNDNDNMLLCLICYDDSRTATDMISLTQCPHKWCRDCLVKIIETEEEKTSATIITARPTDTAVTVTCPECRTELTTEEIDTILYRPNNLRDQYLRAVMMYDNDRDPFTSYPWLRPLRRQVYRDGPVAEQVAKDGANAIKKHLLDYRMGCLVWLVRLLMMYIVALSLILLFRTASDTTITDERPSLLDVFWMLFIIETRDYDSVLKEILVLFLIWFGFSLWGEFVEATDYGVQLEERLNIPFKTLIYLVYSPSWMEEKILKTMMMDQQQQEQQEQRNKNDDYLVPFLFPHMVFLTLALFFEDVYGGPNFWMLMLVWYGGLWGLL